MFSVGDEKKREFGLLLLRLGIGFFFMVHGLQKIVAGPLLWGELGEILSIYGIKASPVMTGWLLVFLEMSGGLLLASGIFAHFSCLMLLTVTSVSLGMCLSFGLPFADYAHPLESTIILLSLMWIGPGNYTVPDLLLHRRSLR
jgi:putative oxidoreductase